MDAIRLSTDFAVFHQTMPLQPIHAQQLIQSTADRRGMNPDHHLGILFQCILGLVKDYGYSFQQIEKTFRDRQADACLIARCRTAVDDPATVKHIFPLVEGDGQISTVTKTYYLVLNTRPFKTAVPELLEEVNSYQENFERLSDTGIRILNSKTVIESYKVGETITITSDGWEEIIDAFALPGTNKDEILALLNTKTIRFRVSENPQLSIADFLMRARFAPESRKKLDAAFGITKEILQTQRRLSEELDRARSAF